MARRSRVYRRTRNGTSRYYLDLRDVTGRQEPLVAKGDRYATDDPEIAAELATRRLKELRELKRREVIDGLKGRWGLKAYGVHHLAEKARSGRFTEKWLTQTERQLKAAGAFFGDDRDVAAVTVADVQGYAAHLRDVKNGRGSSLSAGSQRHYLNALSNLYRRAQAEGVVPPGYNPAAALLDKPQAAAEEAHWLEPHDIALLLESARTLPSTKRREHRCIYPLLATFALTGGRSAEILGLRVDDISFRHRVIHIRPNPWRRIKTTRSERRVPLWPQLEEILRAYIQAGEAKGGVGDLLFTATSKGPERMISDFRKALDRVAVRAGFEEGAIRSKALRHSYTAARLQTLDQGHPVAPWTVARELGHSGTVMIERVYGHLGNVRTRREVVEFRVERHEKVLSKRLKKLREMATKE